MTWDSPEVRRDQLVLFSERLDEVLPSEHRVRRLVEILDQLDWKAWEAEYHPDGIGRPPIHPKVMAGVVLYGLMRGVRSGRRLEEALAMRLDFRWLAEGRSIDHSTLCRFRRSHGDRLKELFVQITLVAKHAGILSLVELAVDGTKIRASNHRSNKYKVEELEKFKQQLQLRFDEMNAEAEALDAEQGAREQTQEKKAKLDKQLRSATKRISAIDRAIEEVEKLREAGKGVPERMPTTDVESRVTKNKEGGFAPNYTPLAVVDPSSGMIAATDVIADSNEKAMLPGALDQVQQTLGEQPKRVLADALFNQSSNLIEMDQRGIDLYSPIDDPADNPAIREDVTRAVAEEDRDALPVEKDQIAKAAFVYVEQSDSYFCPEGKELKYQSSYNNKLADGGVIERRRYHASPDDCSGCLLKARCIKGKSNFRRLSHDAAEPLRRKLRKRMRTDEAQTTYNRRMPCERPFAVIKQVMGVRQFLHRGLDRVRHEWNWVVTAFNLQRLIAIQGARPGPATE